MNNETLTHEILKYQIHYDPLTGVFTRLKSMSVRGKLGVIELKLRKSFCAEIAINAKLYKAHRLAWLYVHGVWPSGSIDHVNRNPLDNRIENLRECSLSQNQMNKGVIKNSTTGFKGVTYHISNKCYQARCKVKGKSHFLGSFATAIEASNAYEEFAKVAHGDFYYKKG